MNTTSLGKKILVLIFLVVVLGGVFLLQGDGLGKDSFSWLKAKIIGLGPELNLAEEDSGIDFTNINMDDLLSTSEPIIETSSEIEKIAEDDGLANLDAIINSGEELIISEDEITKEVLVAPITVDNSQDELLRIKNEIDRIAGEVERITLEIQQLSQGQ